MRKNALSRKTTHRVPKTTTADLAATQQQFNRAGTEFLKVDVATAITFSEVALSADDPAKRRRNQRSARKAYDTILRLAKKIAISGRDVQELTASLELLKANLVRLGEVF